MKDKIIIKKAVKRVDGCLYYLGDHDLIMCTMGRKFPGKKFDKVLKEAKLYFVDNAEFVRGKE